MHKRAKFYLYTILTLATIVVILGIIYCYLAFMPTGYEKLKAEYDDFAPSAKTEKEEKPVQRALKITDIFSGQNSQDTDAEKSATPAAASQPTAARNFDQRIHSIETLSINYSEEWRKLILRKIKLRPHLGSPDL